jgi:hypothetical protein
MDFLPKITLAEGQCSSAELYRLHFQTGSLDFAKNPDFPSHRKFPKKPMSLDLIENE